jgi:hypothetical protein
MDNSGGDNTSVRYNDMMKSLCTDLHAQRSPVIHKKRVYLFFTTQRCFFPGLLAHGRVGGGTSALARMFATTGRRSTQRGLTMLQRRSE